MRVILLQTTQECQMQGNDSDKREMTLTCEESAKVNLSVLRSCQF